MQLGATRWALRKPGTDVMILKNIWRFFLKTTASFWQKFDHNIGF
jgi:hypothetical protein